MIITLDGPSGTGKSTLAKIVASRLGFKFLNSGMIYRALTHYFLTRAINADNVNLIDDKIKNLNIEIKFDDNNQNVYVESEDCTPYVSDVIVNENVSLYSQILSIRHKVLELQRDFAKENDIVIEGRDIGSEVFPNADYKFYVTCDIFARAKRRFDDLKTNNPNLTLDEVVESLNKRDFADKTRKYSPLVRPKDAIDIDTSVMGIDECVNEILSYVNFN